MSRDARVHARALVADLDDDGGSGAVDQDGMASAWESMIDDPGGRQADNGKGAERVLNQDEIDNLLGFNVDELSRDERQGIRAIINSALVSYERLPMLEILFDRLVW